MTTDPGGLGRAEERSPTSARGQPGGGAPTWGSTARAAHSGSASRNGEPTISSCSSAAEKSATGAPHCSEWKPCRTAHSAGSRSSAAAGSSLVASSVSTSRRASRSRASAFATSAGSLSKRKTMFCFCSPGVFTLNAMTIDGGVPAGFGGSGKWCATCDSGSSERTSADTLSVYPRTPGGSFLPFCACPLLR